MAEPSGEKTEKPTPKKQRDARQKGQVARSQEVVTTVSLMSVIAYIWINWSTMFDEMALVMDEMAALATREDLPVVEALAIAFERISDVLLPILGVTVLAGIAGNYLQIGSVFAAEGVMPKLEKVSPVSGFKRIFSLKQLVEFLKSFLKIVFLSLLLYVVIRSAIEPLINSAPCGMPCLIKVTGLIMAALLGFTAFAFVVVAVVDFWYQQYEHTKSLMMTKDEVKREYKESEGDPLIKGQRKQFAHELLMSDPPEQTRKSSALVVNPIHLAIAIDYRPGYTPLPLVTAKGRQHMAWKMREAAEQAGVPVFHHVPLARALYADAPLGDYVPDELFEALAEVLVWVEQNGDKLYKGPLDQGMIEIEGSPADRTGRRKQ